MQKFAVNTNVELVATTSASRTTVNHRQHWHDDDPEFRSFEQMMKGNGGVL